MIVNCEKCRSKFNLDETLVKETGTKVRCSVCKCVFTVHPPEEDNGLDPAMEETTQLESPPVFAGIGDDEIDPEISEIFDKAFEEALQEDIEDEVVKEEKEAEDEEPEAQGESISPLETREKKGPGSLLIVLIVVLLLIVGAVFVYFFAPSILPGDIPGLHPTDIEEVIDTGNRRLDIDDLKSYFLSTDKTGQLYVIEGKVINNYPASRSYIVVKGTIEDEKGEAVDQKLVYAGNIFTENELKGMTREEIEKGMSNKTGKKDSNLAVEPQASVPFMIIFYDLPDNLSEFLVETISSSTLD